MTRMFGGLPLRSDRPTIGGVRLTDAFDGRSARSTELAVGRWLLVAGLSTAIALCATRAHAQTPAPAAPDATQSSGDLNPIGTRIVSDPLFLPRAGQGYGMSAFALDQPTGTNLRAGVATGSFKASDTSFDQTFAYGVTNMFTIRVALGYATNTRDSTAATTGDVTVGNASGMNDPTFSATYRMLDEPQSPLIFDVTASYSPDLFASQASGNGLNGTVARGGQNSGFSLALGREMQSFTIAATMGTTYVGQQTTELLSNNTSTQSDAHWSYNVGLNTQTRFTDRVSLNLGVSYSTAGNYEVSNIQTGNPRTYDAPATTALTLAFNFHLVPNQLVGSVTYEYDTFSEANNIFVNPKADTSVNNRTGNVVGVRLAYTFN